jgi:SAM-dependent methyltransferase
MLGHDGTRLDGPPDEAMTDAVHADVARLLTTPGVLDEAAGLGPLCSESEREQLRKFRGFITKVMQNGIRKYVPKTMATLSALKIELDFYIAISPEYQRLRAKGPISAQAHLIWYEKALAGWAEQDGTSSARLAHDVLVHELVQNQGRGAQPQFMPQLHPDAPFIEGEVILRRYSYDVPEALRQIDGAGTLDLDSLVRQRPLILAYWLTPYGIEMITEVDPLIARALSMVDGVRRIEDIAVMISESAGVHVDPALIRRSFETLAKRVPLRGCNSMENAAAQAGATTARDPFMAAVDGYYLGAVLDGLHRAGVLAKLTAPQTAAEVATTMGVSERLMAPLLAFAARSGGAVTHDPETGRFRVHPSYLQGPMAAHLLDQYIGGYGPCLAALPELLRTPGQGGVLIDRVRHSAAFVNASDDRSELAQVLEQLAPVGVLDLGCGSASLLRNAIDRDSEMIGIGIDKTPEMLAEARRQVPRGTEDRLHFFQGDVPEAAETLSRELRDKVDLIVAQSLANEFFAERSIDDFLARLARTFPGRLLVLSDYYSLLADGVPAGGTDQARSAVHDVAQVLSGQGVPPGNLEGWRDIYARNDLTLLKALSSKSGGVHFFIHIVRL